jgi:hypothetical protein
MPKNVWGLTGLQCVRIHVFLKGGGQRGAYDTFTNSYKSLEELAASILSVYQSSISYTATPKKDTASVAYREF